MPFELSVVVVMVAMDGRILDRAVHPLDLTVGPRMVDLVKRCSMPFIVATHRKHAPSKPGIKRLDEYREIYYSALRRQDYSVFANFWR